MKLTTANMIGIRSDISNYLSKVVDVLQMSIQVLDDNRLAAGIQSSVNTL